MNVSPPNSMTADLSCFCICACYACKRIRPYYTKPVNMPVPAIRLSPSEAAQDARLAQEPTTANESNER